MNYTYMENLILDNIEKNNTLLNIFQSIIEPLQTNYNDDINKLIDILSNNNIEKLNTKIKNKLNLLSKETKYKNINDLFQFIDIFIDIYIYQYQNNEIFIDMFNKINIDYSDYNFNFTSGNLLKKRLSSITKEYEFYQNSNNIINELNKYFEVNIQDYINNPDLYTYISDILKKNVEIIDLYIYLFNIGIKYSKDKDKNLYNYIIELNEINKDNVLDISYKKNNTKKDKIILNNNLQKFNLVSKFLYNYKKVNSNNIITEKYTLYDIINNITKIKSKKLEVKNQTLSNIVKELNIIIKNYSNIIKKNISILIININNNVNYTVDLLLDNRIKIDKIQGINDSIINLFNVIQMTDSNNKLTNDIYLINHKDNTDNSIILQTSDLNEFKIMYHNNEFLIDKNIINKIIRNEPSKRIIKYNQYLEDNILQYKTTEYQEQYALDKYLDFNTIDENAEKLYKQLSKNIYNNIIKKVQKTKLTDSNLFDIINNSETIIDIFNNSLNDFYNSIIKTIKNLNKNLSNDIYLSYIAICDSLSFKFKKSITDKYIYYQNNSSITNKQKIENIISDSINSVINDKSDLYNYIIEKYNILNSYKQY